MVASATHTRGRWRAVLRAPALWVPVVLALTVAALVLLASRQLPAIVAHVLRQSLADPAAHIVVDSAISVGLSGAGIERAELAFEQSGWRVALTLQQVQAGYHWRTLLGGSLQNLSVGRVQAQVQQLPATGAPAAAPLDLAALLQQLADLRLPVAIVHITQAEIAVQMAADTVQLALDELHLNSAEQSLTGALRLRGSPAWLATRGEVHGELRPSAQPWLPALQLRTTLPPLLQADLQWPALMASSPAQSSSLAAAPAAGVQLPFTLQLQLPARPDPVQVDINGAVQMAGTDWSVQGQLRTGPGQITGDWQLAQRGARRAGTATLRVAQLPALVQSLTALQLLKREQLSLASGTALIKLGFSQAPASSAAGSPPLGLDIQVEAGELSGSSAGVMFSGAALAATLRKDARWSTPQPLQLTVATLGGGIHASNLRLQAGLDAAASLRTADWRLQSLRAGLLGGEIYLAEPARVRVPELEGRLVLALSGLQLGQILALYADQGVSGEGTLNGAIPLLLTAAGPVIDKGMLASTRAGGAIRYQPGAAGQLLGQGSQEVGMTLQILEDFRFSILAVTTSLAADGQLLLGVQLAGNNPQVMAGHPVNLNINLEENLYKLLQALQLSDQLSRRIEQQLSRPR